jgi:hypothetical protein
MNETEMFDLCSTCVSLCVGGASRSDQKNMQDEHPESVFVNFEFKCILSGIRYCSNDSERRSISALAA